MTTEQQRRTDKARKYMEDIAKINQRFGMGTTTSEDTYNAAVSQAAAAFQRLPSNGAVTPASPGRPS
jgi:phosphate starvation-inducible protein PhoH